MELKRKIRQRLQEWYLHSSKALLIKGARQVGKTYEIRSMLRDNGCNFIEINLLEKPEAVRILQDAVSVEELIMGLSTMVSAPFIKGKTIIFIDEVQKYKNMVTKIKFLVDEGCFRYIMSGSLLGVEITNLESAPVGYLTTYEMFPLDFEEFLQITNITEDVIHYVKKSLNDRSPVMDVVNDKLLQLYDQYLTVGGMPDAVVRFAETYHLNEVAQIHSDIIKQYKLDFTQYEAEDRKLLLSNIYDLVPAELLKQNRRFIISDLRQGLHFERVQSSFLWLQNAGVILAVYNATEPKLPLKLNEKQSLFKLYLSDVGLLTTVYGMSTKARILSRDPGLNAGGLYENAVVCELAAKGYKPYYYNSNRLGELDFVIEYQGKILPIEVKSGKDYKIHSALTHCLSNQEFNMDTAFVFANCNISVDGKINYLPVYMAAFMDDNFSQDIFVNCIQF